MDVTAPDAADDHAGRLNGIITRLDRDTFGIYLVSMTFVRLGFKYIGFNPYDRNPLSMLALSIIAIFAASCILTELLRKVSGCRRIL